MNSEYLGYISIFLILIVCFGSFTLLDALKSKEIPYKNFKAKDFLIGLAIFSLALFSLDYVSHKPISLIRELTQAYDENDWNRINALLKKASRESGHNMPSN